MFNLCIVLLSVACVLNSLAIGIHVWSVRPFRPRLSVDDVKRANSLQSYFEDIRDNSLKVLAKAHELFSRPCAEDESAE